MQKHTHCTTQDSSTLLGQHSTPIGIIVHYNMSNYRCESDNSNLRTNAQAAFATLADRAVCINLKERDDRMQGAQKRFDQVGLGSCIEFHRVDRDPRGGMIGCYQSHRQIVQQAYDDGLERVMVFEDDVVFHEGWDQVVLDCQEFLQQDAQKIPVHCLYLGCTPIWIGEKTTPKIWLAKACLMHAYILTRPGMKSFLEADDYFMTHMMKLSTGHDALTNFVLPHIYVHSNYEAIGQDVDLGTDNVWFPNLPKLYNDWLQLQVFPRMGRVTRSILVSDWYIPTYFNRNYLIGFGRCGTLKDGYVTLKPTPMLLDVNLLFYFVITTWPYPRGVWGLFADLVLPFWKRLLTGQQPSASSTSTATDKKE